MSFVNNHHVPWLAVFAWISLATVVGLGYARNHGMTGIGMLLPVAVVAGVLFVGFVALCALSIPFLDRYGRPARDADRERGGPGAG
jgi:hypothetical protein